MTLVRDYIGTVALSFYMMTLVQAGEVPNEMRGELLYMTNCDACHTSSMHWREKKLAKDWKSLKQQVVRWQTIAKTSWTKQDIEDVTLYLNKRYYHYQNTEPKAVTSN